MNTHTHNGIGYGLMVKQLAKSGVKILTSLSPLDCHKWHMASCLTPEIAELEEAMDISDRAGVIEESGDAEFYIEGLMQAYDLEDKDLVDIDLPNGTCLSVRRVFEYTVVAAGNVFTAVKNEVIYRKPLDRESLIQALSKVKAGLLELGLQLNISRETVLNANIDKLGKRYKGFEYSDKAAQERADKEVNTTDHVADIHDPVRDAPNSQEPATT